MHGLRFTLQGWDGSVLTLPINVALMRAISDWDRVLMPKMPPPFAAYRAPKAAMARRWKIYR